MNTILKHTTRCSDKLLQPRRLRKQVDFWKEQAGLLSAEAKTAADLSDIADRRCDSPAAASTGTAADAEAAVPGSGVSSTAGSRPSTAAGRTMAAAAVLQAAAAAAAAPAIGGEESPDSRSSCEGSETL